MEKSMPITDICAREVYDPDGKTMIEYEVLAGESHVGRAKVPFPAEKDPLRCIGDVVDTVNAKIAPEMVGMNVFDREALEDVMLRLSGVWDHNGKIPEAFAGILEAICRAAELIQ